MGQDDHDIPGTPDAASTTNAPADPPASSPPQDEGPGHGDEPFTRRVCAVLMADVSGFSALMGIDDEGTARAVRELQTLVLQIVADARGRADAFAGDAVFALFDSVVAAVEAGLNIHRQIAAHEFAGRHLQVRMGAHYGDVLLRDGTPVSMAVGDAISVAARLQTLAKPGTICISEGVFRQVRNRFDEKFVDLGRRQLKNISEPVHAYLLVPRELEAEPLRAAVHRVWFLRGLGATAMVLLVAFGVAAAFRLRTPRLGRPAATEVPRPPGIETTGRLLPSRITAATPAVGAAEQQVALGVMLFKGLGAADEEDWRRDALRDGLNAQLSQLSRVKVYSKEFIDFLMSRKGLTDIEAASELGITKMVSGSFVVFAGTMRIETHVVDVGTGVLEASYTTAGREQDFLALQNKLALGVLSHLNLPVSDEERRTLLAKQTTDEDALRLLLEAETAGAAPSRNPNEPHSGLRRWLARHRLAAVACADDAPAEILAVLELYRQATEAREIGALAALYTEFTPDQQAAQLRYFENVRDLHVAIGNVDVAVVGDEAVVSYTRTDDFVDARTGRPMHVSVRLTKVLRLLDGTWKLAGGK